MLMRCYILTRSSYMTGCELAVAQSVCLKVGHMVTSQVLASSYLHFFFFFFFFLKMSHLKVLKFSDRVQKVAARHQVSHLLRHLPVTCQSGKRYPGNQTNSIALIHPTRTHAFRVFVLITTASWSLEIVFQSGERWPGFISGEKKNTHTRTRTEMPARAAVPSVNSLVCFFFLVSECFLEFFFFFFDLLPSWSGTFCPYKSKVNVAPAHSLSHRPFCRCYRLFMSIIGTCRIWTINKVWLAPGAVGACFE